MLLPGIQSDISLLPPGWNYLWYFVGAGNVQLIIRADISSNAPVQLLIYGPEIWTSQPSTRIAGTYIVDLKAPGIYELFIENPGSTMASVTAFINVTMCGSRAVESWLRRYIEPTRITVNHTTIPVAPMGIASYGVIEIGGRYFTYNLTTDAVKGVVYIPPNILASDYYWPNNITYYGQAFSVRLSAYVVAKLKDGARQYYLMQNFVGFDEKHKGLKVWNNIQNVTTLSSILDDYTARGNGTIYMSIHGSHYGYAMPNSIPFGRVELEMRTRVAGGKIIVEFYANGQKYDEVTITPYAPVASAYIVIAPTTTPGYDPLVLELVFGGIFPLYSLGGLETWMDRPRAMKRGHSSLLVA